MVKVSSNEVRQRKEAAVLSKKMTSLSSGVNARDEILDDLRELEQTAESLPLEAPQEKRRM